MEVAPDQLRERRGSRSGGGGRRPPAGRRPRGPRGARRGRARPGPPGWLQSRTGRANQKCRVLVRTIVSPAISRRWMPNPGPIIPRCPRIWNPAGEPVDYGRRIKPLLQRYCVACHGATRPRAGLRLDTAAGARRGGNGGPSVVPGRPEESLGPARGARRGRQSACPRSAPGSAVPRSTPSARGSSPAPLPRPTRSPHRPPRRPTGLSSLPGGPSCRPSGTPILPATRSDRFVLAGLERDGIVPSSEADRATLIRRVGLDLIGLPPSPEEVEAFLKDDRPDAYERLVDQLLASPHYGERWARPWLDLARYADSNGYSIDAPRSIWPYRDWVIDALNRDLPYDAFATEQLAGDLLPNATLAQRVATGFHRNTPINQEGGIDREQFRVESVLDRTNTTGTAFLGLTVGCCQCHDHKYDPITQEDYYRLFAFFNNADEPEIPVASADAGGQRIRAEARSRRLFGVALLGSASRCSGIARAPGSRGSTHRRGRSSRRASATPSIPPSRSATGRRIAWSSPPSSTSRLRRRSIARPSPRSVRGYRSSPRRWSSASDRGPLARRTCSSKGISPAPAGSSRRACRRSSRR